jgi:hypothetical protein
MNQDTAAAVEGLLQDLPARIGRNIGEAAPLSGREHLWRKQLHRANTWDAIFVIFAMRLRIPLRPSSKEWATRASVPSRDCDTCRCEKVGFVLQDSPLLTLGSVNGFLFSFIACIRDGHLLRWCFRSNA